MRHATALAALIVLLTFAAWASDFSYAQWREMPETWQRGYAAAVVARLTVVKATTDPQADARASGFAACLSGVTDQAAADLIRAYAIQHPESLGVPVTGIALRAFYDRCKGQVPAPP